MAKKIVHDPKVIVTKVANAVLSLKLVSWEKYQENRDAPAFLRDLKYILVQKEALRDVIAEFGQLNMNRAILASDMVQKGCRNAPCLQIKAKNSQARIVVYAFKKERLEEIAGK